MLNDKNLRKLCSEQFDDRTLEFIINLICTIIITLINFGLRKLLHTVQSFGRYDSMTKQSSSLFNNLFVSTFINTSFLITLVYSNIFNFIPMKIISILIPSLFDKFTQ